VQLMSDQRAGGNLIFLLGITPRSGSNYLHKVMTLHPECCSSPIELWEDFLLPESERLVAYASATAAKWKPTWQGEHVSQKVLLESLGKGLEDFLRQGCQARYLVTKTPSPKGVENLPSLFPASRVLLLVRDGRDVACSGMSSFGWTFEYAVKHWKEGARHIIRFREEHPCFPCATVRYEDLFMRLPEVVTEICTRMDLSVQDFSMEAASRLPVKGSSDLARAGGHMHWNGVERTSDFQPVGRWRSDLTSAQQAAFWEQAHQEMTAFGYTS
jgi:hypothetical protein